MDAWYAISAGLWWPNGNWGSRGAPFGEDTLSPLRRYLKPLPKGGRGGGGGGERGTEAPLRYLEGASDEGTSRGLRRRLPLRDLQSLQASSRYLKVASSVEALAEAFEGTLRELRRLRRHLKGASKPFSTDLQIQFLKLPP